MPQKELVMYSRSSPCPFVSIAKQVLAKEGVQYREIHIDRDEQARKRVVGWTGFESVPTLIVAASGADLPIEAEASLETGRSPRGIDRGSMITEPDIKQLTTWLDRNGLLQSKTA
jgi:glutaredoxin